MKLESRYRVICREGYCLINYSLFGRPLLGQKGWAWNSWFEDSTPRIILTCHCPAWPADSAFIKACPQIQILLLDLDLNSSPHRIETARKDDDDVSISLPFASNLKFILADLQMRNGVGNPHQRRDATSSRRKRDLPNEPPNYG